MSLAYIWSHVRATTQQLNSDLTFFFTLKNTYPRIVDHKIRSEIRVQQKKNNLKVNHMVHITWICTFN